ncbi:MAG: Asp-tRNA(Asn)/Glu-tRNA(Gln) amidotransferase subunit GatC [Bdellovibrionia bacterium]
MSDLNASLTERVAHLAKLSVSPSEVQTFTQQLDVILSYVQTLQSVPTEGVEPMTHPFEMAASLREDVPEVSPTDEKGGPKVLTHAPDVLYHGFKVPPIL